MKIKIGVFVCILMLFVTPILFAEDNRNEIPVEEAMEAFCGTWFFEIGSSMERIVYNPDGTAAEYLPKMETPYKSGNFKIEKAWKDSEGNIWLTYSTQFYGQQGLYFCKISNNGTVWERARLSDRDSRPTEIGPNDRWYLKAIRKKSE